MKFIVAALLSAFIGASSAAEKSSLRILGEPKASGKPKGSGKPKASLCHWQDKDSKYKYLTIGTKAVDAHYRKHSKDYDPSSQNVVLVTTYEHMDDRDDRDGGFYSDPNQDILNDGQKVYESQKLAAWIQEDPAEPHLVIFTFQELVTVALVEFAVPVWFDSGMKPPTSISVSFSTDGVNYGSQYTLDESEIQNQVSEYIFDLTILGSNSEDSSPECSDVFGAALKAKVEVTCPEGPAVEDDSSKKCGLAEVTFYGS
jgi:hypothetical protein